MQGQEKKLKGLPNNSSIVWQEWMKESENLLKELYLKRFEKKICHIDDLKKLFLKVNNDMNSFHFDFSHLNKVKH